MHGVLHIFRTGTGEGRHQSPVPVYQVNYTAAGRTYARILEDPELVDFLRDSIAMDSSALTEAVSTLRSSGQVTAGEVEISENDAGAMGLTQSPSEI